MELFDIGKLIFTTKQKEWDAVSKNDKSRNFFMLNRIMSIQYPTQANQFNHLKVIPAPVIDWWHDTLSHRYSRPPQWLFTKVNKKDSKEKTKNKDYSEVETVIRDKYKVSKRDLADIKKFYPKEYDKWVSNISDQVGLKK